MSEPILDQEVAALFRGRVHELAEPRVGEVFSPRRQAHTGSSFRPGPQAPRSTAAAVTQFAFHRARLGEHAPPRAVAPVDQLRARQPHHRVRVALGPIHLAARALAGRAERRDRRRVGDEPEPLEVIEDARLEFAPCPRLVVILDAQVDEAAERPRDAPDEDRVDEVSEMEMSGRRRRESRDGRRLQPLGKRRQIDQARPAPLAARAHRPGRAASGAGSPSFRSPSER